MQALGSQPTINGHFKIWTECAFERAEGDPRSQVSCSLGYAVALELSWEEEAG
jgi:hypothetical protein